MRGRSTPACLLSSGWLQCSPTRSAAPLFTPAHRASRSGGHLTFTLCRSLAVGGQRGAQGCVPPCGRKATFSDYAEALFKAVARTTTLCLHDLSADDAPSTCKPCAHQCESRGHKSGFIVQRRLRLSSALCRRIGRTIKDYARVARRTGDDMVKKLHGNAFPQLALFSVPSPP